MCAQNLRTACFLYILRLPGAWWHLIWTAAIRKYSYIVQSELLPTHEPANTALLPDLVIPLSLPDWLMPVGRHLHSWPRQRFSQSRHEILKIMLMPPEITVAIVLKTKTDKISEKLPKIKAKLKLQVIRKQEWASPDAGFVKWNIKKTEFKGQWLIILEKQLYKSLRGLREEAENNGRSRFELNKRCWRRAGCSIMHLTCRI